MVYRFTVTRCQCRDRHCNCVLLLRIKDNLIEFTYIFAGRRDIYESLNPDTFLGMLEFYCLINKIQGPNSAHGRFFM